MKVRIDEERCTGHGRCYMLAADVFETDDRGYGVVVKPDVPPELEEQARRAADNCPEQAVIIE